MTEAVKAAIDLLHIPSYARTLRSSPLPEGMHLLLQVAAGEPEALQHAEELTKRPGDVNHKAAVFYIEQILFHSDDSFRNLGLDHTATTGELRAHMALLLKWLHPDLTDDTHKSLLARRVIRAWREVKSHRPGEHSDRDFQNRIAVRALNKAKRKRVGNRLPSRVASAEAGKSHKSPPIHQRGGELRIANLQKLVGLLFRLRRRIRPI